MQDFSRTTRSVFAEARSTERPRRGLPRFSVGGRLESTTEASAPPTRRSYRQLPSETHRLGLPAKLRRSLACINSIENMMGTGPR